jgi:hypothetical protein
VEKGRRVDSSAKEQWQKRWFVNHRNPFSDGIHDKKSSVKPSFCLVKAL